MKKKPTEFSITISGDYTHELPESEFEAKIQPIEKAAFSLLTFFNFIKTSALYHEGEATAANAELGHFCGDLITLSEIGFAMSKSILRGSSELFDFQLKPDAPQTAEASKIPLIATQISNLLTNPNVPPEISDGLAQIMTDFYSWKIDQTEINDDQQSPEYIAKLLRGYEKRQSETTSE